MKQHSAKLWHPGDDCFFIMEMLFLLHRSKKKDSGKAGKREAKKRDGLLKRGEQGELKHEVGRNIVVFYRISSFSNDCGNSFSLLFVPP